MYIVFFKDNKLGFKLIQWWTRSDYNHCEIWTGKELVGVPSKVTQVRRMEQDSLNPKKWEVFEVLDSTLINTLDIFYNETQGLKYDNKAIFFSNIFNKGEQDKDRYTCS